MSQGATRIWCGRQRILERRDRQFWTIELAHFADGVGHSPLEELVPLSVGLPPTRRLHLDPIALPRPIGCVQPLGPHALEADVRRDLRGQYLSEGGGM
jgi:hypothetical protein